MILCLKLFGVAILTSGIMTVRYLCGIFSIRASHKCSALVFLGMEGFAMLTNE